MKLFSTVVIAVVALTVIASFFLIGSPHKERERQFDTQRSNDLSAIRYQVNTYWQTHNKQLPKTLNDLVGNIPSYTTYTDPITNQPYEYMVTGDKTFALCAVFSNESNPFMGRGSQLDVGIYGTPDYMTHPAGRYCFEHKIDENVDIGPTSERGVAPIISTTTVTSSV